MGECFSKKQFNDQCHDKNQVGLGWEDEVKCNTGLAHTNQQPTKREGEVVQTMQLLLGLHLIQHCVDNLPLDDL